MSSKSSLELSMKSLPGSSDDLESAATAISTSDSDSGRPKSTTLRTFLAVFLIVGVVAAVGICTAVFAPGKRSSESKDIIDHEVRVPSAVDEQNLEPNDRRLVNNDRDTRSSTGYRGRARKQLRRQPDDCFSEMSNDTIPAAHIKGRGIFDRLPQQFTDITSTDPSHIPGYQTTWTCNDHLGRAFVDGGMRFNHNDNRLYVPKCGYYYLSSQVYFQLSENKSRVVQHQMRVERNCPEVEFNNFHIEGLSAVPSVDVDTDTSRSQTGTRQTKTSVPKKTVATSTTAGEVVKLCAGGRIYIEIPESVPCCADGRAEQVTFFGAVLVAETNCDWPPEVQNHPFA